MIVAARAGCATIEHGQYINEEALRVMRELGTVWTPTYISTEGFALPHDDDYTPMARRVAPWILDNQRRAPKSLPLGQLHRWRERVGIEPTNPGFSRASWF